MMRGRVSKHAEFVKRLGGITELETLHAYGRKQGAYGFLTLDDLREVISRSKQLVRISGDRVMLSPKLEQDEQIPVVINWGD